MSRRRTNICPRCKVREKGDRRGIYCPECRREVDRMYRLKRSQRLAAARRKKQAPAHAPAPESQFPKWSKDDCAGALDAMRKECARRGYDPDMILGLARVLPKLEFSKNQWGTTYPVWRGKVLGKSHKWRPCKEVM